MGARYFRRNSPIRLFFFDSAPTLRRRFTTGNDCIYASYREYLFFNAPDGEIYYEYVGRGWLNLHLSMREREMRIRAYVGRNVDKVITPIKVARNSTP